MSTPAVVHNTQGDLVLDLTQENFRVSDNGAEQKIEGFEMGGAPFSVAIVMETSSRIEALLPAIRRTGIVFTQTVLGESGDAAVIGYNDRWRSCFDFTSDHDAIEKTISKLQEGTSGARLYDALAQAVGMLRDRARIAAARDYHRGRSGRYRQRGKTRRSAARSATRQYHDLFGRAFLNRRGGARPAKAESPDLRHAARDFRLAADARHAANADRREQQRQGATWTCWGSPYGWCSTPRPWCASIRWKSPPSHRRTVPIDAARLRRSSRRSTRLAANLRRSTRSVTGRQAPAPGDYHEIKVEVVDRRGLKVRSRPGYYLGNANN